MTRNLAIVLAATFVVTACGKKQAAAPPPAQDSAPAKSAIDLVAPDPNAPPPPPTAASVPAAEAPPESAAPQAEVREGNWWAHKTHGEKQEIMEGWLHQYQLNTPGTRAAVMKEIQNAKLSEEDKAALERLRNNFKYPPLPIK